VNVPPAAETTLTTWRDIWSHAESAQAVSLSPILEPRKDKPWYDRRR
jgi:hypothetical protein